LRASLMIALVSIMFYDYFLINFLYFCINYFRIFYMALEKEFN